MDLISVVATKRKKVDNLFVVVVRALNDFLLLIGVVFRQQRRLLDNLFGDLGGLDPKKSEPSTLVGYDLKVMRFSNIKVVVLIVNILSSKELSDEVNSNHSKKRRSFSK